MGTMIHTVMLNLSTGVLPLWLLVWPAMQTRAYLRQRDAERNGS